MQKVSDWIDIEAPCREVFDALIDIERRMQLSPIWGLSQLLAISPNFPETGSSYRVRVLTDAPFGIAGGTSQAAQSAFEGLAQLMALKVGSSVSSTDLQPFGGAQDRPVPVTETESSSAESLPKKNVVEAEQEYVVSDYQPPHRFSYYLAADCKTIITWKFQSIPRGTRVNYEEVFCPENTGGEDFLPTVRHVIHEWLVNIKRYNELRGTRGRLFLKKLLDRFYLKLRPDQRRTVLLILFMQGFALVTFVVAAIGLAIAGALI
jgi:hypothetical protein